MRIWVDEGERQVRPGAMIEHGAKNRNGFHFAPVEFAVEEEAEAMGLAGRAAQEVNGPGEAGGVVGEVMFFEFDGIYVLFSGRAVKARETNLKTAFESREEREERRRGIPRQ